MTDQPRVLLAEDNPALLRVTLFALQRAGFIVETACNGAEAFARLEAGEYDLLVTDQQMPRMTGLELVQAMRGLPAHTGTPAVLLTAKALELNHPQLAEELGVSQVLGKPFSPVELSRVVQGLLSAQA